MKTKSLLALFYVMLSSCASLQDQYVEAEGIRFNIYASGHGKPTVLFESGMASDKEVWNHIPDSISTYTSVFGYDRAGIGKSDGTTRERTIPNMVAELKWILEKENIDPPYLYVAHSMGSYLARYFSYHFPEQLKGIILIDPSPDQLYDDYTETEYREFLESGNRAFMKASEGERKEWESYLDNRKYVQGAKIPDTVPVIIISASQWDFDKYHRQMLNIHPLSRQIKVESGHNVHKEKPQLIIDLIKEMIKMP